MVTVARASNTIPFMNDSRPAGFSASTNAANSPKTTQHTTSTGNQAHKTVPAAL